MAAKTGYCARDHHGYARVRGCGHGHDRGCSHVRDRAHTGSDQKSENVREVYG